VVLEKLSSLGKTPRYRENVRNSNFSVLRGGGPPSAGLEDRGYPTVKLPALAGSS